MLIGQHGSAPFEAIVGIVILMVLTLGAIQIAVTVYAHNAVRASAYEGARAAAELGTRSHEARAVAERAVSRAAGGLLRGIRVTVARGDAPEGPIVRVEVSATQRAVGPVPIELGVRAAASTLLEQPPE